MTAGNTAAQDREAEVWQALETVVDPEIPVISIVDLGLVRAVRRDGETCEVVITPSYSGCPAMPMIESEIVRVLEARGLAPVRVTTVLSPAWTTDWLSEAGRRKLRDFGIAPPKQTCEARAGLFDAEEGIACPRCGSRDSERISEFGSTACKALYRCRSCREPFDYFKCI
jgi:ring-1,2-phenylacetyl-CoA epoxidase subunit PaaD